MVRLRRCALAKVESFLTMNDSVMVSGTCYGMLECITNLVPWESSWINGWKRHTDLIRTEGGHCVTGVSVAEAPAGPPGAAVVQTAASPASSSARLASTLALTNKVTTTSTDIDDNSKQSAVAHREDAPVSAPSRRFDKSIAQGGGKRRGEETGSRGFGARCILVIDKTNIELHGAAVARVAHGLVRTPRPSASVGHCKDHGGDRDDGKEGFEELAELRSHMEDQHVDITGEGSGCWQEQSDVRRNLSCEG